jgi:histidinol dehydrogenase
MNIYQNPDRTTWPALVQRPQLELEFLDSSVRNILGRVKKSGDAALREFSQQFDHVSLDNLLVTEPEVNEASALLTPALKDAISQAAKNIELFHAAQQRPLLQVDTMPGVRCWRKGVAIESVGIYIPGGSAPLFSTVLMLGVPAQLAGCREVVLCTPPQRDGKINPAILFAAQLTGITKIVKAGGAQAIAAMAFGTESVPRVSKIFGPGNQYVTKAKQLVGEEGVAIDMPAGPSEVLVLADETANAAFVAADLLAQAEHGPDSQVMLVTTDATLVRNTLAEIDRQVEHLPRKDIARTALANSAAITFSSLQQAVAFTNAYAPEHLIINTKNDEAVADQIINAGSVFLGAYTPEAAGDYASGTNHTLPTSGYARATGGVSLESFMRYITYQKISPAGLRLLGPIVETMAAAEMLQAHKNAVSIRLKDLVWR